MKKPKLTENIFEQEVINALSSESSEIHKKTNFYELLQTKYTCTKAYTLKWWDIYYNKHVTATNNALNDTVVSEKINALKIGLKTKIERLLILQKEVENCTLDLENGFTEELKSDGQLLNRPITIQEKTALRNTIKNLQSEISKIEGDYAPMKNENTNFNIDKTPIFNDVSLDE